MKKIIIVSMFIVLVIGCDISSVFENMPDIVFPPEKESTEYILQSGNPLFYFGFGVEELEFSDNTIRTGDFEYLSFGAGCQNLALKPSRQDRITLNPMQKHPCDQVTDC